MTLDTMGESKLHPISEVVLDQSVIMESLGRMYIHFVAFQTPLSLTTSQHRRYDHDAIVRQSNALNGSRGGCDRK